MKSTCRWPLLVIALAFAVGCAGKVAYEKPGSTEADRKRDVADCVHASIGHEAAGHVVAPVVIDREAFAKCLESRGYSRVFKLLLNGTSVEVANGRDVSASTIVLNGRPAAVAGASVVLEMGMAAGMR